MHPAFRPQGHPHRKNPVVHSGSVRVDVAYTDGAILSFNFPRSMRITDLNAQIRSAGTVRKVVL